MAFIDYARQTNWKEIQQSIQAKNIVDVEYALSTSKPTLEDFKALISPAAATCLEQMAQRSHELTQKRFGKTIQMYIPLYLSNACHNHCVYCGFNHQNKFERVVLTEAQIEQEIAAIKKLGYEHLLFVTGESNKANVDYLERAMQIAQPYFKLLSLEVQPLEQDDYERLIKYGLNTVYLYQETYNKEHYKVYHPAGKKSDYEYRIDSYERLGRAGIHKIGLGVLLGLEDWRADSFYTAMHLKYLRKTYWKSKISLSFPRLRPHAGGFKPNFPINDKELVQLMCAYRIFDEDAEISLSTREMPEFRNNMLALGVTSMSAGSRTDPGGYAVYKDALKQFEPGDNRSPDEVMQAIKSRGYEAVWKDWDVFMQA